MIAEAPPRVGWRPRGDWDVCSLGWAVLEWTHANLPDPRDVSRQLVLTPEQARRVLRIYELDPVSGRRLYSRVHQEEAKGWGKGPVAAMLALAEFGGAPVVFDHWGEDGQPVGKPWGSPGLPVPYVQVVAVSMDQTFNCWSQVMTLAAGARGELADIITVDSGRPGRTMLRRRDIPAAELARVTASAISREGALVVHSILDEVQLWTPSNAGDELARVVLRNLDKTGGWAHFLGNAPVLGLESVAEIWGEPSPEALHFATRPAERPEQDWTKEQLRDALQDVYAEVPWIDIDRQLESLALAQVPWDDTLRFKFNVRTDDRGDLQWMPVEAWEACEDASLDMVATEPTYACVRVAHDHRSAALAWAQRRGDRVVMRARIFDDDELYDEAVLDVRHIEAALIELHRTYRGRVLMPKRYSPKGRERFVPVPGPEIAYHGSFFERSAQVLSAKGLALIDLPDSQERLAPASETLLELALSGKLAHDGDAELAAHVYAVDARPAVKGWTLSPHSDRVRIHAATAAMHAVHRAMTGPRPQSRRVRGLRR